MATLLAGEHLGFSSVRKSRYPLSYRNARGDDAFFGVLRWITRHSTALILKYAPDLDLRIRPYLKPTNDSWRVDETYIKVKGQWKYLYRAVDSQGSKLDFMLTALAGCVGSVTILP